MQLTAKDALAAHAEVELQIDPDSLTSPWHAAYASMGSFFVGALLPLVAALVSSPQLARAAHRRRSSSSPWPSPAR